jgi:hypothetical protein
VAGREFTVSEFNVRYWRKQKNTFIQTTNKSMKAFRGPKSGEFPKLEDEVLEYVRGVRKNGVVGPTPYERLNLPSVSKMVLRCLC